MAIVGTFTGSFEKGFEGKIETLVINADISIERIAKKGDGPDYRVFHTTETFRSDIGGGWIYDNRDGGGQHVSVSVDDPAFPERTYFKLVKTGAERGFTLYWNRPKKDKAEDKKKAA